MENSFEDRYRFLDHTADVQVECFSSTFEGLMATAARAMYEVALRDPRTDESESCGVELDIADLSDEEILVGWLQELLFLLDSRRFVAVSCQFSSVSGETLSAVVRGYLHGPDERATEIKAATYHDLVVEERDGARYARLIFDL